MCGIERIGIVEGDDLACRVVLRYCGVDFVRSSVVATYFVAAAVGVHTVGYQGDTAGIGFCAAVLVSDVPDRLGRVIKVDLLEVFVGVDDGQERGGLRVIGIAFVPG